jgi:hypothetical protein
MLRTTVAGGAADSQSPTRSGEEGERRSSRSARCSNSGGAAEGLCGAKLEGMAEEGRRRKTLWRRAAAAKAQRARAQSAREVVRAEKKRSRSRSPLNREEK